MTDPKYEDYMKPILLLLSDGHTYLGKQVTDEMAKVFNLSDDYLSKLLPSGKQTIFKNRVGWAETYLKKANLIESSVRGSFIITSSGKDLINSNPSFINKKTLMRYDAFQSFLDQQNSGESKVKIAEYVSDTPQGLMDAAFAQLDGSLRDEILSEIMKQTPEFFEKLVLELLNKMGYGGALTENCTLTAKSGDHGIDGIIKEDKLGFDKVYIQAKRWDRNSSVGSPEIQRFAGALLGQGAQKGAFITTANFSKEALVFSQRNTSTKIVLIDGIQLAKLLIEYNVGVSTDIVYEVKKIDIDYFTDDNLI